MKNFFPANKQCAAAVVGLGVAISTISFMAQATEVVSQSQEYEQIGVVDKTIHILEDASYILGLSYIQMTYKVTVPLRSAIHKLQTMEHLTQ